MYSTMIRTFLIAACTVGAVSLGGAQQSGPAAQSVDIGKYEYDGHCAACHGSTGKGDGFYALMLPRSITVTNLTELSKKNNGVFPFARVYETIDGRQQVKAHGTRDMPIWGRDYRTMSAVLNPYYNQEAFVRAKILALTEYVYRLQAQ